MVNVKVKFALLVNVKQKLMIKVKVTQPKEKFLRGHFKKMNSWSKSMISHGNGYQFFFLFSYWVNASQKRQLTRFFYKIVVHTWR